MKEFHDIELESPPAGSWVRGRSLPRPADRRRARLEPEWGDGAWHLFLGDRRLKGRGNPPRLLFACGHRSFGAAINVYGHQYRDVIVVVGDAPAVDACRRCLRLAPKHAHKEMVTAEG